MTHDNQLESVTVAPYGSWRSPLSIENTVAAGVTLREFGSDGRDLYWLESDPHNGARLTLLRRHDGGISEVTPAPINVRTRVFEYGGGSWAAADGIVVWSDDTSGQVMGQLDDGEIVAITPADRSLRYASFVPSRSLNCIVAVREDHTGEGVAQLSIVALPLPTGEHQLDAGDTLVAGADFYADLALSAEGQLCWVEWNQPHMPWDATRLRCGLVKTDSGATLGPIHTILDGQSAEKLISVQHPLWAPNGRLLFMSDESGWWNLQQWTPDGGITALTDGEHDLDLPVWQQGRGAFTVAGEWIYLTKWVDGVCQIERIPLPGGNCEQLATVSDVSDFASTGDKACALIRRPDAPPAIAEITASGLQVIHCPSPSPDPQITSIGQSLTFKGVSGPVQCWFYPPHNARFTAPKGQLPPVIVTVHGGPTGMATNDYDPQVQFWTSRGFGILAVNYSGSAGFGRGYRERLRGNWGITDVNDCVDAAAMLVKRGLADASRIAIMGGSAGGFTVLAALTNSSAFSAGISRYGIADLVALQADTHKFEAAYNDGLLGSWPQSRAIYEERSPIHHLDKLHTPMLIMQGLDDAVVPPAQATQLADALRERSMPVSVVLFEGEGHGFRRPETHKAALAASLSFLGQLFGFAPVDEIPELTIENLR